MSSSRKCIQDEKEIFISGRKLMTIDSGDRECDSTAVVTREGESEEIELIRGLFRKGFQKKHRHLNRRHEWW